MTDLLEELKQAAAQKKANDEAQRRAENEAVCDELLRPVLLRGFDYLRELVAQLEVIDLDVRTDLDIIGLGKLTQVRQTEYHVGIDDQVRPNAVKIQFRWLGEQPLRFEVEDAIVTQRVREELRNCQLMFRTRDLPPRRPRTPLVRFEIDANVKGGIELGVNAARANLLLQVRNLEQLGTTRHYLEPDRFDDAMFDQLGRFLLRRQNHFLQVELSEAYREQLQKRLRQEQGNRVVVTAAGQSVLAAKPSASERLRRFLGGAKKT